MPLTLVCGAQTVHAQVSGTFSLQSDYLARGYSVSGHRPAAIGEIAFDDPSGVYANGVVVASDDGDGNPALAGLIGNIGYARKVSPRVSLEVGYVHIRYFHFAEAPGRADVDFDEVYIGAVLGRVAFHTYYAPDYLNTGIATLYNEIQGTTALTGKVQVHGLLGRISYFDGSTGHKLPDDYRWALGLSRPIGRVTLDLTLDGGRSSLKRMFGVPGSSVPRLIAGVKLAF